MALTAHGTVTFETTEIDSSVRNVVINQMADIAETTSYDDATWKTFIAELKEWDGTLDLNWDSGNTHTIGDEGTLAVTITSGPTMSGEIIFTNIGTPMPKGRLIVQSVSFKGTGALTIT